jgi:ornithine cyclodeaminase/alanine dehydrogenase-like protein (mu-crystallin family)
MRDSDGSLLLLSTQELTMPAVSRRDFLQSSAALTTAASLAASAAVAKAAAADVLNIALIGCGGMGSNHLKNLSARKDVKLSYVCDVDGNRLATAAKVAAKLEGADELAREFSAVLVRRSS